MSESFVKTPSSLIFNPEISPLELRVLMVLMFWSGINTQEPGHIKYGAEKLGKQIGVGRVACRRALLRLRELNLITINHRGNLVNESYGLSNDIELTLAAGIEFLQKGSSADKGHLYLKDTGDLNQNDTGDASNLYLNDSGQASDLYLKDTGNLNHLNTDLNHLNTHLNQNDTGHIDDRFKININLNKIGRAQTGAPARTHERTHNETGDGAPVRSMPKEESARDVVAASSAANNADQVLLRDLQAAFTDIFSDLSLSKAGNTYILRKKGKYALIEDVRLREVVYWLCARGLDARIMDTQTRVLGEVLLEEVA